ncbi:HD domain-containing protein 2, partial [Camellia lanceoleosa]
MSSGSQVFCKSFLVPSLASTELIRFKFFRARTFSSNPSRVFRMATEPPSSSSNGDSSSVPASSAINFLSLCHRLKVFLFRYVYIERDGCEGVENPESIANHMYRMGLMALIASDRLLSDISIYGTMNMCIKMAIVHDIIDRMIKLLVGEK